MTRVKRGVMTKKRHKNLLQDTKGYRMMNGNVFSRAKNARMKAGLNAFIGRKLKKRTFRTLWNTRLSNALKPHGVRYSVFIHQLYLKHVKLDRKALSNLAIMHPQVFAKVVDAVK